ncbi:MAG TPA: MBG domain-containing protein [Fimbriiglobus sp.]|nr:MBG domain-containing protein [Fimbriiglobus sp.]
MRSINRGRTWTGWLTRTASILRPFPVLRFEQLEDRLAPATFTWSGVGADANWSTAANWVGGVAPAGNSAAVEDLVFPAGPTAKTATNDLPAGGVFNSITFGAGGYTLAGNPIVLGLPATTGSGAIVVNTGALGNVLNIDTKLGASANFEQTITVESGAELTVAGKLSGNAGSTLTKDRPGTLKLTNDNSGFPGTIRLLNSSGALVITHPLALGGTAAPTIVGTNSSLRLDNVPAAITEPLILNGPGVANDGALLNLAGSNTWAGPISLDSNSTVGAAAASTLAITGVISDTGAGHDLVKEGQGEVQLNAANTYRGLTTVHNGVLTVGNAKALGADGSVASGTLVTQTLVGAGQLRLADPGLKGFTVVNEFLTLNGAGLGGLPNPGSLTNALGNNTWAGPVTLGSPAPDGKNATIGAAADTNMTISGVVSSPNGTFQFIKRDKGRVILNNANTYTGATSIQEGILNVRDSKALGATSAGTTVANKASLEYEVEAADPANIPRFDAQGRDLWNDSVTADAHRLRISEPLNLAGRGLNNVGALRSISGINEHTTNVLINIDTPNLAAAVGVEPDQRPGHPTPDASYFVNDYSLTITGVVQNATSNNRFANKYSNDFVKRGAGHLILPVANTYAGYTRIEQGWVTIQNNRAFGADKSPVVSNSVQPGTFVSDGAAVHVRPLAAGDPPMSIAENITITGFGIEHPYAFLSKKGALMNLGGANVWAGDIGLSDQAAVGVELTDKSATSELIVTGAVRDGSTRWLLTTAGGGKEERFLLETGATSGKVRVHYDMYTIADTLTVYYPAGKSKVIDTGAVLNSKIVTGVYGPDTATAIEVVVNEGGGSSTSAWILNDVSVERPGGLVKTGSRMLSLRGEGTYSGASEVREGTLRAQNDTALGLRSSGTFASQQTYTTTTTTVAPAAVLELTGGLAAFNGGVAAGIQVWNEQLVLNSPGYQVGVAGVPAGTFTLTYGGQTTVSLSIAATGQEVQDALNALSSVAGSATVTRAGNVFTVVLGTALGANAGVLVATPTPASGAEVTVSGGNFPLVNLSVNLPGDDNAWRGPVSLGASSRVFVEPNSRLSLLGAVGDATNPTGSDFVKRGLGELVLAGANTFRGTTAIDEGVLTAMNSQAFGTTAGGTVVADGAQVQLQGSLTVAGEPLTVSGSGAGEVPNIPARWFNTGPTPTNNGHSPQNLPTSGRITSVASDPTDPDVIYAAAAGGGLWKTENGGLTWVPLFDGPSAPPAAVTFGGWVAVAPTNPNVVYFGTGEPNGWPTDQPIPGQGNNLADNFAGSGVYRSTNAGATWVLLTSADGSNPLFGQAVTKVIVDPTNAFRVYVSSGTSNTRNVAPDAVPGVYRFDGNWVNLTGAPSFNRANTVGSDPFDADSGGPPRNAGPEDDYRILFPQSDATWSDILLIDRGGGLWMLYAALGDSNQRYYGGTRNSQGIFNAVYRTENPLVDNPDWWLGQGSGVPLSPTAGPVVPVPIPALPDPTMPDGRGAGFPVGPITPPQGDPKPAGDNGWIKLAGALFNTVQTNYGSFYSNEIIPGFVNAQIQVYASVAQPDWNANFGELRSIQKSGWDGSLNDAWTAATASGLPVTEIFGDATFDQNLNSPSNTYFDNVFPALGAYDHAILVQDYSPYRDTNFPPDTYNNDPVRNTFLRDNDPNVVYIAGKENIYRSTDGGANFAPLNPDANGAGPARQFHSLYLDRTNRLVSGSDGGVWRWDGETFSDLNGNLAVTQLISVDPHPTDPTKALAGAQDNGTQRFDNDLAWQRLDDDTGTTSGAVRYDPLNPQTAYAVRDGLLRKTTDGGATWTTIRTVSTGGIDTPPVIVESTAVLSLSGDQPYNIFPLIVDPVNPQRLLIGGPRILNLTFTQIVNSGLWESSDGGATWTDLRATSGGLMPVTAIGAATFQGQFAVDPGFPTVTDKLSNTYDPNTIYVTDGTRLAVTKNRGVSWSTRTPVITDRSFTVTFAGTKAATDVPQMSSLGGHSSVTTVTPGSAAPATDEVQRVALIAVSGSTFTLTFDGQTTAPIPVDATLADILAALEALPNIDPGDVTLAAGPAGGGARVITDLSVDPSNRDTIYASLSWGNGVDGPRVIRSNDAGRTWTDISDSPTLPTVAIWKLVVDPRDGTAYLGTDSGVWQLPDADTTDTFTWSRFGSGMPTVQVRDLVINQTLNTLTAASYGRGMFQLFLPNTEASSGAIRAASGSSVWTGPVTLVGDTALGAAGTQQIQNGIAAASLNIIGVVSDSPVGGNFVLRKIGRGTVTLSGSNTFGGKALVEEGVLQVNNPRALGSPTTGNTVVTAGAALELRSDLEQEPVTINGDGFLFNGHNTGALRNVSNDNTYTGTLTFGTDTTIGVDSGTSLTVGQKPTLLGTGTITDGKSSFKFDKELSGTLILAGGNTYDGLTRVVQGALQVQHANALGGTAVGTQVLDGAVVEIARNSVTLAETTVAGEPLTLSGTGIFGTGALRNVRLDSDPTGTNNNAWQGPVTLNIAPNFFPQTAPGTQVGIGVADARDTLTLDGVVGQDSTQASFGLVKVGPGLLALTRANTFTGVVSINEGSVLVRNGDALGVGVSPEVQTLNVVGTFNPATGKPYTYTLSFQGKATAPINATADAKTVQTALEGLTTVGAGNVLVFATPSVAGQVLTVTFQGTLAGANQPQLVSSPQSGLAVNVVNAQEGGIGTVLADKTALVYDAALVGGAMTVPEHLTLRGDGLAGEGGLTNLAGDNVQSGDVVLASDTSIAVAATTSLIVTGSVMDPTPTPVPTARLRKLGTGALVFGNANPYGGKTLIDQGVLRITNGLALGAVRNEVQNVLVLATNGTFTLNFAGQSTAPLAFNALDTDVRTALNGLSNIGGVGGSVAVVRTAVGSGFHYTVTFGGTLANANVPRMDVTFTGGVFAEVTTAQDGSEGTVVADGATLQVGGGITVAGEKVTVIGAGVGGQGALDNVNGTNTWAIPLTLAGDATIGAASGLLTFTAPITDGGKGFNVLLVGPGTIEYAGTVDNQYTGTTTVSGAVLRLNQPSGVAVVGPLVDGTATTSGLVLELRPNQIADTAPVTVNPGSAFFLNEQSDRIGLLTVTDGFVVTGGAAGTLTVAGLAMTGGTIQTGVAGAVVLEGNVTATSSATGPATIAGPGFLRLNGADRTITVADGPDAEDLVLSAVLVATGAEQLVKAGAGQMAVDSTTFDAPITVQAGELQVNDSADVGPVRLAGGTLSGGGFVDTITGTAGPAVGTVSPGVNFSTSPFGVLTSDGNVAWGPQTTFFVDLSAPAVGNPSPGGTYDVLDVGGAIDLGGATLAGLYGANIELADQFTIVTAAGGVTGKFAEPFGANVAFIDGRKFTVEYQPNAVVLTKLLADAIVAVSSSANPSTLGQPVLFTANVTPEPGAGGLIDSKVTFTLDGTTKFTAPVDATGVAVFDPGPLAGGTHTLTVFFDGDPATFNPAGPVSLVPDQFVEVPAIDPLGSTPPFFSPNNSPGVQDVAAIATKVQQERSKTDWTVTVRDGGGGVVRVFTGQQPAGAVNTVPVVANWDGKDGGGAFVPDGKYTAVASFADQWGNKGTTNVAAVTVDNTAPTVGPLVNEHPVIAPGTSSTVPTTTRLTDTVGDLNLTNWTLTVADANGNPVRTFVGAGTTVNVTWDGRNLVGAFVPDGIYTVTLTATDRAGNTTSSAVPVVVLTQPPVVALATNSPSAYGQAITLTATVSMPFPGLTDLLAGDPVQFFQGSTLLGTGNLALDNGQFRTTLTLPVLDVGTYTGYTAIYLPTAEFLGAQSAAVTHVVTPAQLAVSADSLVKPYGTPLPPLTFTTVGLANGDTAAEVLAGALATTATQQSVVGDYPITQGSLTLLSGNYTLTFTPGTLTVVPSQVVVTADSLTKVYGAPLPPLTVAVAGLAPWDTVAGTIVGAPATTAVAASNVGVYPITQGTIALANPGNPNYVLSFVPSTLTVTPAPLTVTADNQTRLYGDPNPALTYTVGGLVNGDLQQDVVAGELATPAVVPSPVGDYPIVQGSLTASANYQVAFVNGVLHVAPAPLTVRVADARRVFNTPNPPFTATFEGLRLGDTPAVVSGVDLTTTATQESVVGKYPIFSATTPTAQNYAVTVVPGTLTVGYLRPDEITAIPSAVAFGSGSGVPAQVNSFQPPSGLFHPTLSPFDPGVAFNRSFTGGVRVAAADFTGDGVSEIVLATGPGAPTLVTVLDGKTRAEVFRLNPFEASFTGGVFVTVGDVTGDGVPDLAVSPDEGGGPRMRLFDGNGFGQLADFFGIDDPNFRGGARAGIGDINADGYGDLVVAAGFGGGPRVAAFSGKALTRGEQTRLFADFFIFGGTDATTLRNGVFIAAGDVNGDGFADVVAGGGPGGGPRVLVADGKTLLSSNGQTVTPVANFFAGDTSNRGGIRVAVKKLDTDQFMDVVTGAGDGGGSRVTGYSGAALISAANPPALIAFDAFDNVLNGVFVG